MENIIIIAVVAVVIVLASLYIYRAKKSGKKCIGCPDADTCASPQNGGCSGSCGSCGCNCADK